MIRSLLASFASIVALSATGTLAAEPAPAPPAIIDLTGDYSRFYHETEGQPAPVRVAKFKELMEKKFPGFYSATRLEVPAAKYDAWVKESFDDFPAIEAKFTTRAAALPAAFAAAQRDFARTFPDSGPLPPTYVVHSLGEMDGGTREIGGKVVLVFGADVMALVHKDGANERPFLEHELFHTFHEPRFGECKPLWCALWEEGLATYVADQLNPGATSDELLLTEEMRRRIDAIRVAAVCAVRQRVMSEDGKDYSALFNGGRNLPGLPERAGYYVGYLVAKGLGEGRSLSELARWDQNAARPHILAELAKMAPDCPAAGS
jgi:hypothetical protein